MYGLFEYVTLLLYDYFTRPQIFRDSKSKSIVRRDQIQDDCSICLEGYDDKASEIVVLLCSHIFHLTCIDDWTTLQHVCPLCRRAIDLLIVFNMVEES